MELIKENGMDVLVTAGGIIPKEDVPMLKKSGIAAVFGPGTAIEEIVKFHKEHIKQRT